MRVLMLAFANNAHTQRWANSLSEAGCEIHLAYLPEHAPTLHRLADGVVQHELSGHGQLAYFTQALAVRRLWRRIRPDVTQAHYASGYGTTLRLARLRPSVLSAWGSDVFEFPDRGRLQRALIRANLGFPDAVTSSSHIMATRIGEVTSGRVQAQVIPFGVDLTRFFPAPDPSRVGPVRFGIVKTLEQHYRIDVIIRAFSDYLGRPGAPEATLDIYGAGPLLGELTALGETLRLGDLVRFQGAITHDAVPAAVRDLDVFLLASETESFGVAAVEAMACGVPVIASDAPGFVEVLDGGRFGLLYPRGDVAALADLMFSLATNKDRRQEVAASGVVGAQRYDWSANVAAMRALLESYAD